MTTLQLLILCLTIFGGLCVICYTAWAILTNDKLIRYTHDYLTKWRDTE